MFAYALYFWGDERNWQYFTTVISQLRYVDFGDQERRDFDYQKEVLNDRIGKLESKMSTQVQEANLIISEIKDFLVRLQRVG